MIAAIEAARTALEAEMYAAGRALNAISGAGPMGLTPDSVKASPEWKAKRASYDRAFAALRAFNTAHSPKRRVRRTP